MSEKRFKLIKPLGTRLGLTDISIKDTQEDYYYNTKENVVDLLNKLSEENEKLRQQVQNAKEIAVKNDMQYQICRKEKEDFQDMCEQLKKEHKIAIDEMITDYKNLEKENEQLRKEHQEMLEKYVLLRLKIGEVLNDE